MKYSPDLSPIEPCRSQVKTALRKAKARTIDALESALETVLSAVTAVDARNWFVHCGYPVQQGENRSIFHLQQSNSKEYFQVRFFTIILPLFSKISFLHHL
jgi:hypothetical protein